MLCPPSLRALRVLLLPEGLLSLSIPLQVPVPDGVADEIAAQFLVNPITIVGMLEVLQIPEGDWLVQDAAGSVLGRQMIQYAKLKGLKTINIIRRPEQVGKTRLKNLAAPACNEARLILLHAEIIKLEPVLNNLAIHNRPDAQDMDWLAGCCPRTA